VAFGKKTKTKASPSGGRASSARKKAGKTGAGYIFWLVFFIVIICLFIVNLESIQTSLRNTGIIEHVLDRPSRERNAPPPGLDEGEESLETVLPAPEPPAVREGQESEGAVVSRDPDPPLPGETPAGRTEPASQTTPAAPSQERPAAQQTPSSPVEPHRERVLYFMQVDPDGTIMRIRTVRRLPVTDSPMIDVLNTLLQGPSLEEINRGVISLIPQGTRLLTAAVKGSTAEINFNENFLFNEYGVEGYAGQLRQRVWTVTEFPTVKDVQIQIEGRPIDYLGESIWIGSPVGRESR
jgi:hypothetical protein